MPKPLTYTQAKADEICLRLSEGEPLAKICRDDHLPAVRTVSHWKVDHPGFAKAFKDARENGYDALAAECLRIADTTEDGIVEKLEMVTIPNPDTEDGPATTELRVTERRREDMLGHRKLKIETRMKLLAKWDPARYGDKVQLADAEGNVMQAPQWIVQPVQPAPRPDGDA